VPGHLSLAFGTPSPSVSGACATVSAVTDSSTMAARAMPHARR
jgi:hypothetical protein